MTVLSDKTETDSEALDSVADDETTRNEAEADGEGRPSGGERTRRRIQWKRLIAFGLLPGLALLLALGAGYLRWADGSADDLAGARAEAVRVAADDTVALLSYKPESVDKDLGAARERLTGEFKEAYSTLIREVVIPGAKEKHITAVVKVTAAAPVSVTANHAVVLLFANQTVTIGEGVPTDTQPVIRVALDKVDGRWLVSHFDPV